MAGELRDLVFAMWFGGVLSGFAQMLLAALLAAALTHWLTHRRFIQERWWDRKADAYGEIIGTLVSMVLSLESWIELHRRSDGRLGPGELLGEYRRYEKAVERVATEGDYVISRRASGALAELVKLLKPARPPGLDLSGRRGEFLLLDSLELYRSKAESCLKVIRDEAKSDLRVRRWSL